MTEPGPPRLLHPAGCPDDLSGDPGRVVGGQEDDHAGDVRRRAEAAERGGRDDLLPLVALEQVEVRRALGLGGAGATASTRTFRGAGSSARPRVRLSRAAFVDE